MSVLRLFTVYNERDIIRENIEFFINQGIESIVLDNYSKDGTYEILKEYEGKGIRWIERYKTEYFNISKLNAILINLAQGEKEKFFIWVDADELLYFFHPDIPLRIIIPIIFSKFKQINVLNASKVEFYHTESNNIETFNMKDMKYFYFEPVWKDVIFKKREDLVSYLDKPLYSDGNGLKKYKKLNHLFFLKHFPFRTLRQTKKKVYRAFPKSIRNEKDLKDKNIINWHLFSLKNSKNLEQHILRDKKNMFEFKDEVNFYKNFLISIKPGLERYLNKIETIVGE